MGSEPKLFMRNVITKARHSQSLKQQGAQSSEGSPILAGNQMEVGYQVFRKASYFGLERTKELPLGGAERGRQKFGINKVEVLCLVMIFKSETTAMKIFTVSQI